MAKTFRVDPAAALQKAGAMEDCEKKIENTFGSIDTEINSDIRKAWESDDASRIFYQKYDGIKDDIQRMFRISNEYIKDLRDIAQTYRNIEQGVTDTVNPLSTDIFNV